MYLHKSSVAKGLAGLAKQCMMLRTCPQRNLIRLCAPLSKDDSVTSMKKELFIGRCVIRLQQVNQNMSTKPRDKSSHKFTYPKLRRSPRPIALEYMDSRIPEKSSAKGEELDDDLREVTSEKLEEEMDEMTAEIEELIHVEDELDEEFSDDNDDNESDPLMKDIFSGPDPSCPISKVPCSGCGALLHCQNPGIQGYVPAAKFKSVSSAHLKESGMQCQRCVLLRKYNIALNASVSPEQYKEIISSIHEVTALVLVVVDVMDMPNSLYAGLSDLIGHRRPVYVIGNKVDLLPRDESGYLTRVKEMLVQACEESGLSKHNFLKHVSVVSAKTGYGIEELVTKLMDDWDRKGHVYLVGCTNAGKSTMYNALLSSDYCKSIARDFMYRATVSQWPGTTLNLLKFPIVSAVPWRLKERAQRLLRDRKAWEEEENLRKKMLKQTGSLKYATLIGHVGQTFMGAMEKTINMKMDAEPEAFSQISPAYTLGHDSLDEGPSGLKRFRDSLKMQSHQILGRHRHDEKSYKRWCYDTPGLVNPKQIINLLNQHELSAVLMHSLVQPRSFVLKPKEVMLVGGLGRIDYVEGHKSIYFTVLASPQIPVRVFNHEEALSFYMKHLGSSVLGAPLGDKDRLLKLPSLIGREFHVVGEGWYESCSDIVLSSLGWVGVTAGQGMPVTLQAYTPGGQGCVMRSPSLLKYAINLRGRRKTGRAGYHVQGLDSEHHPRKKK